MREHLASLDREFAFQTSARFDLLANGHVPHAALGARDIEGSVVRALEKGEGIIAISGRMGSGKSSLIAAVIQMLDEGFVPLRISVVGVEAEAPVAFARHVIQEIRDLPETHLTRHERSVLERATAISSTRKHHRELRAGFRITAGPVLSAAVVGDIKQAAAYELAQATDPAAVLSALQRLFDTFWRLGRCPVLIVDDTDHWGGSPRVANAFFDQTTRALERQDAVLVIAAQSDYTRLRGYQAVRNRFTAEVALPVLPDPHRGVALILQTRIDSAKVPTNVEAVFEDEALRLVVASYTESVIGRNAGDMRRTIAIVRNALELAVEEPGVQRIGSGHVQEAIARNPLVPGSALSFTDGAQAAGASAG
jgi:Cdc6-like AAA superfamily ATPase